MLNVIFNKIYNIKGPNIASMGLISANNRENETKDSININFENVNKINSIKIIIINIINIY